MFGKIITAIVTPFDENKNIDYLAFGTLLKKLENEHSDGFVICGTTGESATLTFKEKINMIKFARQIVKKETKIIAGIGTNNTMETIKQIKILNNLDFDAYMIVTPYYNKPSQEGLYEHFKLIDEVSKKPIIIYNVLSRCGVEVNYKTLIRLYHDCNNIVGLKHASTNIQLIAAIKKELPDGDNKFKIACLVILDEYSNLREKIYADLKRYPLIRSRISQINSIYKNPKEIEKDLNRFFKRIEWHINRLYRTRNAIIHSGENPNNLKLLTEHLHNYVDEVLVEIMVLLVNTNLSDISGIFINAKFVMDNIIKLLKKGKKISEEDIQILMNVMFLK